MGVTERCVYLKPVLLVKDNSGQQLVPGSGGEEDHRRAHDSDEGRGHMRADSSLESCGSRRGDVCVTVQKYSQAPDTNLQQSTVYYTE